MALQGVHRTSSMHSRCTLAKCIGAQGCSRPCKPARAASESGGRSTRHGMSAGRKSAFIHGRRGVRPTGVLTDCSSADSGLGVPIVVLADGSSSLAPLATLCSGAKPLDEAVERSLERVEQHFRDSQVDELPHAVKVKVAAMRNRRFVDAAKEGVEAREALDCEASRSYG